MNLIIKPYVIEKCYVCYGKPTVVLNYGLGNDVYMCNKHLKQWLIALPDVLEETE